MIQRSASSLASLLINIREREKKNNVCVRMGTSVHLQFTPVVVTNWHGDNKLVTRKREREWKTPIRAHAKYLHCLRNLHKLSKLDFYSRRSTNCSKHSSKWWRKEDMDTWLVHVNRWGFSARFQCNKFRVIVKLMCWVLRSSRNHNYINLTTSSCYKVCLSLRLEGKSSLNEAMTKFTHQTKPFSLHPTSSLPNKKESRRQPARTTSG